MPILLKTFDLLPVFMEILGKRDILEKKVRARRNIHEGFAIL